MRAENLVDLTQNSQFELFINLDENEESEFAEVVRNEVVLLQWPSKIHFVEFKVRRSLNNA